MAGNAARRGPRPGCSADVGLASRSATADGVTEPVRLHGWSSWSATRIAGLTKPDDVARVPGDFVVVAGLNGTRRARVLTSAVAATPFYAAVGGDGSLHAAASVFEAASSAGLSWRWDLDAVRNVALL